MNQHVNPVNQSADQFAKPVDDDVNVRAADADRADRATAGRTVADMNRAPADAGVAADAGRASVSPASANAGHASANAKHASAEAIPAEASCADARRAQAAGANAGKAAIFDLDGTLLDSMGVWDQIDRDFFARRGIAMPEDYTTVVSPMQFRQIAEYTIARFGLPDTPDQLMDEWDRMAREAYATTVTAKPGVVAYLRWLRDSGARMAVATTLTAALREPALEHLGLAGFFETVVTPEDVGGVGKERPDVVLAAAARLGVAPADCTVFEDMLVAMRSAKAAGMRVWAMLDDSSRADWPAIEALADGTLTDFAAAPRVL